jgi:acetyl esterase/lipase
MTENPHGSSDPTESHHARTPVAGNGYVDPELAPLLATLPPNRFGIGDFGADQAREELAGLPQLEPPSDIPVSHRDLAIGTGENSSNLRIIAPNDPRPDRPCIFWIHGGGYIVGSPFITDLRLFRWSEEHDCVIVAVQYGLAPDHPYPQGLEDCYRGLQWVFRHAKDLGIDPTRIALAGESAGGGLAAALAVLARDRAEVPICFQQLIYPMLDDRTALETDRPDAPVWTKAANAAGWAAYLADVPSRGHPPTTAAPGRATPEELTGLPPCFITVGSLDLFRDEDIRYAGALQDAGVPTELHVYAGAFHGSDHLAPEASISRRFERDLDTALGRVLMKKHADSHHRGGGAIPNPREPEEPLVSAERAATQA